MERFLPVVGFEGYYVVSSAGYVISLHKNRLRILRMFVDRDGYSKVALFGGGKSRNTFLHRVLAEAFIPNPEGLPCVNHKDEDKQNNDLSNLEWCTVGYNNNYGSRLSRAMANTDHRHKVRSFCVPVAQLTRDGEFVALWNSQSEASRVLGIPGQNIGACANGRIPSAGGFLWERRPNLESPYPDNPSANCRKFAKASSL